MSSYKVLVFDLDDTLLDTSGLIIPQAVRNSCQMMLDQGLKCSMPECLEMRADLAKGMSHTKIFARIADHFGCTHRDAAVEGAIREFYNPAVPAQLPLLPGALENLEALKSKYVLYLVTAGTNEAQQKKVAAVGVAGYFKKIFILDSISGSKKDQAFREILEAEKIQPKELLSIGNRLSSEIRHAKMCGCDTCYFAFGEHLGEIPEVPEDHPDYTIHFHRELIAACNL